MPIPSATDEGHSSTPVTRGARICTFCWMQSIIRDFFHATTDWHRFLTGTSLPKEVGKAITGAACLALSLLLLSGLYLWWPRPWRWASVRAVILVNPRLRDRARNWNLPNVFGFWSALPLLCIIITDLIMSYSCANNLLFTLTGTEPPPPHERPAGGRIGKREGAPAPLPLPSSDLNRS